MSCNKKVTRTGLYRIRWHGGYGIYNRLKIVRSPDNTCNNCILAWSYETCSYGTETTFLAYFLTLDVNLWYNCLVLCIVYSQNILKNKGTVLNISDHTHNQRANETVSFSTKLVKNEERFELVMTIFKTSVELHEFYKIHA